MRMDPFTSRKIHFLGELEGPPVQELKHQLSTFLNCEHEIKKAYLVRINRDEAGAPSDGSVSLGWKEAPKPKLALCLAGERTNAVRLAATVGAIFSELFPGIENMEVVFMNDTQLREVSMLAQPFYASDGSDQCRPN